MYLASCIDGGYYLVMTLSEIRRITGGGVDRLVNLGPWLQEHKSSYARPFDHTVDTCWTSSRHETFLCLYGIWCPTLDAATLFKLTYG
jgi:hypothetical protein